MATITVLGAGMMGSALCVPLVDAGHDVRLVGTHLDEAIIAELRASGRHPKMNHALADGISFFDHGQLADAVVGCDALALGVSSAGVDWAIQAMAGLTRPDMPIFMITKGLHHDERGLNVFPDEIQERLAALGHDVPAPAAIAGPCIAGELARRVPTCVVLTGRDEAVLERVAGWLATDYYHVWTSTDVVGNECCAALKNAYAMAVAFGAGLHERRGGDGGSVAMHNFESAVFAQAVYEMTVLVELLGGRAASVAGLAGAGDLDVTNNGGRTGRFGRLLGLGLSVPQAVERMEGATLECLEIIAVMRAATAQLRAAGKLSEAQLPLLGHMAEVVLDGAAVNVPFRAFFGGRAASS